MGKFEYRVITMNRFILLLSFSLLAACSAPIKTLIQVDKSPNGITIENIIKEEHVKAYRLAEKHCAKYAKVPRVLKSMDKEADDESSISLRTTSYECLKATHKKQRF